MAPFLSTEEFVSHLRVFDWLSSDLLKLFHVNLDVSLFVELLKTTPLQIVNSSDGQVSIVQEQYDPLDFSHQSGGFDLHTDGLYYSQVPDFVILYCEDPGAGSASTIFSDTRLIPSRVKKASTFEVLQQLDLVYIGKDTLQFPRPLVEVHPRTGEPILSIGTRGFIRPRLTLEELSSAPSLRMATRSMNELFNILNNTIVLDHHWSKGDLLLFDNNTYAHGRKSQESDPGRKLLRIWLSLKEVTC